MRFLIIILEILSYFLKALSWSLLGFFSGNIEQFAYIRNFEMYSLLIVVSLWVVGYVFSKLQWNLERKEGRKNSFRDCSVLRWSGAALILICLGGAQLESAEKAIGMFFFPGIYLIAAGYLREHKYDKLLDSNSSNK